jgi:hypothetical protein
MTADLYRRYAAECLQLSTKFTNLHGRSVLRAMAIVWADLAEQVERREAGDNESPHHTQPAESPKRGAQARGSGPLEA